jgi:hypothetical protein
MHLHMLRGGNGHKLRTLRLALWHRVAAGRWTIAVATLLAVVLTLPSLRAGLFADDHYQRWLLTAGRAGNGAAYAEIRPAALEMFTFVDGDPRRTRRMKELGLAMWCLYDGTLARFCRPLTSATHMADYALWPRRIDVQHAHSIAWYAALVAAVALLYRRMMGRTAAAAVAAVMFAIDDAHALPVGWLASRNALIAAFFGVLTILAHHRWRTGRRPRAGATSNSGGGDRGGAWGTLAVVAFGASLLAGEAGVATFAYLLAFAIVLDRSGTWARRLATLIPYVIVIIAWRAMWSWRGYGVIGIETLYTDPLADPRDFLAHLVLRLPLLLAGQWAYPPADVAILFDDAGKVRLALVGAAVVVVIGMSMWRALRHSRVARFWGLGMVLSAVPLCAAFPSNRMLLFVGIGAFGLLGQVLAMALHPRFWRGGWGFRRLDRGTLVAAMVALHLVVAPAALFALAHWPVGSQEMWATLLELPDVTAADRERDVIVVNHPIPDMMMHTLTSRATDGRPLPRTAPVLAPANAPLIVRRVDERTLTLRMAEGYFSDPYSRMFHSREYPPRLNDPVDLPAVRVTIVELTADGRPREVKCDFRAPLEDAAALRWLCWRDGGLCPFTPPPVGHAIELPAARFPF